MRILHIIASTNPANGGPIEGVRNFGGMITEMGNKVEVACLDAPDSPWLRDFPLPVYPLGPGIGTYGYSKNLLPWLKEHYTEYDACIVNGIWQYNSYAAWSVLQNTQIPYYVFTHGMLDPWFRRQYPIKHLKKLLYWPAQYKILRDATAVCFTSEEEKVLARESFKPYRVNEQVVAYGVKQPPEDTMKQQQAFLARCPETTGKRIFLYLSRIHEKKGCDLLIRAFAEVLINVPQSHLVMAGPDRTGLRATLERLTETLGIAACVSWPGMLSGDEKWGAYRSAEVFILPSHQENFGIAVVEAMGVGCPVLISDKVNIWREILGDGGGLVQPDTLAGTVALLRQWLDLSVEKQQEMRIKAQNCFTQRYEIHQAAEGLLKLLGTGTTTPTDVHR